MYEHTIRKTTIITIKKNAHYARFITLLKLGVDRVTQPACKKIAFISFPDKTHGWSSTGPLDPTGRLFFFKGQEAFRAFKIADDSD